MSSESPKTKEPVKLPVRQDREVKIKEMEIETVNRVISDKDLKTQYSQSERILLPILKLISLKPFPISEKICQDRGIPYDFSKCTLPLFFDMVTEYIKTGKALNRKGIGEDVSVVSAYFQAQIERSKEAQARTAKGWEK